MTDLHDLLIVQQHDTTADQLRHRRAHLPERALLGGIEGELGRLAVERRDLSERRDALAVEQSRREDEVATCERKRADLERKLSAATVPREAQALSSEIDGLKARQSSLEDELLELMEAAEPIDARLAEIAAESAGHDERALSARAALAAAEAELDQELATEAAARAAAAASIGAAALGTYEKMRAKLGGVAVATLDHKRCTGCNLTLSTRELEALRAAPADELVTCEQCGRILVR
jgi:predicted  nucleic acid-binding Zn-ribbon protein